MEDFNKEMVIKNHLTVGSKTNGFGITGFVIALIALFFGWIPFVGNILWLLGVVFSGIGLMKPSKGLAIAGMVISFLGLIIVMLFFGGLAIL